MTWAGVGRLITLDAELDSDALMEFCVRFALRFAFLPQNSGVGMGFCQGGANCGLCPQPSRGSGACFPIKVLKLSLSRVNFLLFQTSFTHAGIS